MADYPTKLEITVDGIVKYLQGTLSDSPEQPPVEPPVEPPTYGVAEKVYAPESFANFTAMHDQMITDQTAAGDGLLRCVVQFQRGKTYEYTDNQFLNGVQSYRCEAIGSGARPKLRNIRTGAPVWILEGPLCLGKGANCFAEPLNKTTAMALIDTAQKGATTVQLQSSADAAKLKAGRWHAVFSCSQQITGYPPNVRWIDYCKVVSISGRSVTLDRALQFTHFADYWEDPADQLCIGKARIGLWDGFDGQTRCNLDGHFVGLEFVGDRQDRDTTYLESHINCLFEDCSISNFWPSMNKHVEARNCELTGFGNQAAEPDKLSDTLIFDGVTATDPTKYIGAVSGFTHFIMRNCNISATKVSPRHLEVSDSIIDSYGSEWLSVPISWNFQGPILEATFSGVTFRATTAKQPTWTWNSAPTGGDTGPLPLSSASWQGKKLIIPRGFAHFEAWLVWLYEGIMLFTGPRVYDPQKYGRVDKLYAPPDGSAIWCDVTWISGSKPTSGNLHIPNHGLRKLVWSNGTKVEPGNWIEPDFVSMEGTPADRAFPQGIS